MSSLAETIRARQRAGVMAVIAEVKVRSPKEGDLLGGRDPRDLARAYTESGAAGISVVTEERDFGGSIEIVRAIRSVSDLPILRKNFPATAADLAETLAAGAQAQLLTVRMLEPARFLELHAAALELGLETLVEVHDASEVAFLRAHAVAPSLVGVNNRDIAIGETDDGDVSRTERFMAGLPFDVPRISESAISGPDDARRARDAGADAILVGTAILRAADPAAAVRALADVGVA